MGPAPGNAAFFGWNVLQRLVDGIGGLIHRPKERCRHGSLGAAVLGSSMCIDDDGLIGKIGKLSGACIVVSKQAEVNREASRLRLSTRWGAAVGLIASGSSFDGHAEY